ncbi:flavodoxin [Ruminococcus sp.]|uniref:flavodoxin n=1 Tax=Ruminococcus sp. TaxID=41978 RepID=UPI002873B65B|nr:flavodoxin [Ruminococcus sp.]
MKRVLSLIISLVLALSVFSVMTASAAEEPICGDADGDGTITIMDATTIQRHLVDILQLSEERLKAADISGDGIDITDATQIQRWLAAYQVSYPIGELIEHEEESNDTLVVVFSRTGHTKPLAEYAATYLEADLFEIEAAVPYTDEDIAYYTNCRADREQSDPTTRPEIANTVENMEQYDTVVIAYPIWHGQAPKIIYTFLESYDFSGKMIIPFCTSASSGIGSSATNLHPLAPDAIWKEGRRFAIGTSQATIEEWLATFQ